MDKLVTSSLEKILVTPVDGYNATYGSDSLFAARINNSSATSNDQGAAIYDQLVHVGVTHAPS